MPERVIAAKAKDIGLPAPRPAYFGPEAGWLETPVIRRDDLKTPHQGPCIVEEYDATVVIPPRAKAQLDPTGNILIELL